MNMTIILCQPGFRVKPATTHQEIRSAQLQASSGHHHYNWFSSSLPGEICRSINMDDFDADKQPVCCERILWVLKPLFC